MNRILLFIMYKSDFCFLCLTLFRQEIADMELEKVDVWFKLLNTLNIKTANYIVFNSSRNKRNINHIQIILMVKASTE